MKKALALILVFGMVLALGVTAHAESKEINIFMWSDYISDDLIANFEDEYGVIYNMVTYEKAVSCIDEDSLEEIAEGLGVEYVHRTKSALLTPLITEIKAASGTITEKREDYITYHDTYFKYVPYLAGLLVIELFIRIRENAKVRRKNVKKTEIKK